MFKIIFMRVKAIIGLVLICCAVCFFCFNGCKSESPPANDVNLESTVDSVEVEVDTLL